MSADPSLPDPKAKMSLMGQADDEAAAAVKAQREAKKAEKAARKAKALDKAADGDAPLPAASPASPPGAAAAPPPASAAAAPQADPSLPDPKAKMHLMGQADEDSAAAVKAQREAKKAEKEARKAKALGKSAESDNVAVPAAAAPAPAAVPSASAAAPSDPSLPDPKAKMSLMGQADDEAAAAVKAQREAKKAEKAARQAKAIAAAAGPDGPGVPQTKPLPPQNPTTQPPIQQQQQPQRRQRSVSEVFSHPAPGGALGGVVSQSTPTTSPSLRPESASASSAGLSDLPPLLAAAASATSPWLPFPPEEPPTFVVGVHPRIAELGLLYHQLRIVGGNARTIAFIDALREAMLTTPILNVSSLSGVERQLVAFFKRQVDYLAQCREPCAGMAYVAKVFTKRLFSASSSNASTNNDGAVTSEESSVAGGVAPSVSAFSMRSSRVAAAAPAPLQHPSLMASSVVTPREVIVGLLDELRDEIFTSLHAIVEDRGPQQISDGDRILVHGRSSAIELILKRAANRNVRFSVVVLDSSPLHEGRGLSWRLQQQNVDVTYGLLTSVCVHMPRVTKVFIGASAVLNSGDVLSRSGTAMVACAAKQSRKPVICFCESYKFTYKVWLGSLTVNEDTRGVFQRSPIGPNIGAPIAQPSAALPKDSAISTPSPLGTSLRASAAPSSLSDLSDAPKPFFPSRCVASAITDTVHDDGYLYDLTPAALVDMVVCEMGPLHPSAISSAIRDREEREMR